MKLRPARTVDVFRLVELLVAKQAQSIYAGRCKVDQLVARQTLARMIQRHGGTHDGASCVFVVENGEEVIQAFCVGALDRVYHIGEKLVAQDVFLVADAGAPLAATLMLVDAYLGWAESCPDVLEINLSWTDVVGVSPAIEQLYARKGFTRCGAIFRRAVERESEALAA